MEFTERGRVVVETAGGELIHLGSWVRRRWVLDAELISVF